VFLLGLRDAARDEKAGGKPATELVPKAYVTATTIAEFLLAVARLGGHQNRKSDGHPGWLTLWRGWQELSAMMRAVFQGDRASGVISLTIPATFCRQERSAGASASRIGQMTLPWAHALGQVRSPCQPRREQYNADRRQGRNERSELPACLKATR
jgi:hypothetical protein